MELRRDLALKPCAGALAEIQASRLAASPPSGANVSLEPEHNCRRERQLAFMPFLVAAWDMESASHTDKLLVRPVAGQPNAAHRAGLALCDKLAARPRVSR
jgi:hypothetical protein